MGDLLAIGALLAALLGAFYVLVVGPVRALWAYATDLRYRATHKARTTFPPRRQVEERRCPFCHDGLREPGAVCSDCLAHHHPECRDEHGACAACGGVALLGLAGRRRTHPLRRRA